MRNKTRRLTIGEAAVVVVWAWRKWNATGVEFAAGDVYFLGARGWWFDSYLPADPDGVLYLPFWLGALKPALRDPASPWYSLIGLVAQSHERDQFLIGREAVYSARGEGELLCYANDVPGFYWNNFGCVSLTIKRIA